MQVVLQNVQITSYQHSVMDNNHHGTHVAGAIGAVGNNNHNETTMADEDNEPLADLFAEDAEHINGGPGGWGCSTCDYNNHNETLAEDHEAETAFLADLSLTDGLDEQVSGGEVRVGKLLGVKY